MKAIKRSRDVIYISGNLEEKSFCSSGIEFSEFMSSVVEPPENLILLKHNFDNVRFNMHTRFEFVTQHEIEELLNDNVYAYGDFCWVDFLNEEALNRLTDDEIAELLFFGHLARPLHTLPKHRFAYYAHDDGWFNKLYVSRLEDYKSILLNTLKAKVLAFTGILTTDLPADILKALMDSTERGLLINFAKILRSQAVLRLPLIEVGHFRDMDELFTASRSIQMYRNWLEYSNKTWRLIAEE